MKLFVAVAWSCGILGALIIITGTISLISGITFFGLRHVVNYFHVANSILLLGILSVLAHQGCLIKKD
jgi:hypothetical protein